MTDIYRLTVELTKKYKTRDPFSLADSLGIDVDCADLGSLKGFYIVYNKNRFVVLNTSLTESLSRVILAHEIGHDRLHRAIAENGGLKEASFFDMKSRPEMEANVFAANLLITDKEVIADLLRAGYIEEVKTEKKPTEKTEPTATKQPQKKTAKKK